MIKFSTHKLLNTADGKLPLDVSFTIEKGSFVTICGNSGAGKTTILRILAGLTQAEKTKIEVNGEIWDDSLNKVYLPIQKRNIGFVFQDYALFPNLNVLENLEYAIRKESDKNIIPELLDLLELNALQKSNPMQLSGGQKQRVALARAIVCQPKILLLDEPLSSLDDEMRFKIQDYLLKVHKHFNLTTLLVSHHLPEIFKLSDSVIVLEKGKVKEIGSPERVFTSGNISSKFKITGEVLSIEKNDVVYVVRVLSGSSIVKIIASVDEIQNLKIGQKVLVASKAFNPMIIAL